MKRKIFGLGSKTIRTREGNKIMMKLMMLSFLLRTMGKRKRKNSWTRMKRNNNKVMRMMKIKLLKMMLNSLMPTRINLKNNHNRNRSNCNKKKNNPKR